MSDAVGAAAAPKRLDLELTGRCRPARAERFAQALHARAFRAAKYSALAVLGGAPPAQRRELARLSGPFVARPAMEFFRTPFFPAGEENGRNMADNIGQLPVLVPRRLDRTHNSDLGISRQTDNSLVPAGGLRRCRSALRAARHRFDRLSVAVYGRRAEGAAKGVLS